MEETESVTEEQKHWGKEVQIDIHDCNGDSIRDAEHIKKFTSTLVERIKMKAYGDCLVVNFGEDERVAGFSMVQSMKEVQAVQLIETSCITMTAGITSAHFANQTNRVYLNVFSCAPFESQIAEETAVEFFGGKIANSRTTFRD